MPRLIDSDLCQHCGKILPDPKPRACPHCGGSQQRRFLACGCLTSAPPIILIGCLLAFHHPPTQAADPSGRPLAQKTSLEKSQLEAPKKTPTADLSTPRLRKSSQPSSSARKVLRD